MTCTDCKLDERIKQGLIKPGYLKDGLVNHEHIKHRILKHGLVKHARTIRIILIHRFENMDL